MSKKFDSGECLLPNLRCFLGKDYDAVVFCVPQECLNRLARFMHMHNCYVGDYASHAVDNLHVTSLEYKKLCLVAARKRVSSNCGEMDCYVSGVLDILNGGNPNLQSVLNLLLDTFLKTYNRFERLSHEWETSNNIYLQE